MFKVFSAIQAGGIPGQEHAANDAGERRLPCVSSEWLILGASLFFSICSNRLFWSALLAGRSWSSGSTWLLAGATFLILTALHSALLSLVVNRWTAKPVLAALFIVTAAAAHYMNRYTVFLDPGMVRNVLHTDLKEARELLSPGMLFDLAIYGMLPVMLLVSGVRLRRRSWGRAMLVRAGFILGTIAVAITFTTLVFQDFSASIRNHKELRYLITPGNYITSFIRALNAGRADPHGLRIPVGADAALATAWPKHDKPVLLVLVVGETARAANWGLNGYARQTTPKLAELDIINFTRVTACGTNTEVSLPCMFSPFGRKNYDEKKIHQHESVLHLLERAGFKTLWRDNQSGCKGVCDGLEQHRLDTSNHPALCDGERCLDEILLEGLDDAIRNSNRNLVVVLHQLGNHGPAYFRRYPQAFRRFTPSCDTADLGKCSQQEIINSYDNALLYTDHFLDQTIHLLKTQTTHDAAMIYVSDHGESLGEKGIYLHGLPYAIAPKEQTEVPMVMWLSPGFASGLGITSDCLRQHTAQPISHDYLFHSVLGLLQVKAQVYDPSFDLSAGCRV